MRYWTKNRDKLGLAAHPDVRVGLAVATYRQKAPLECLLQSLLAQTHRNFSVAVVHDGPWDPQHQLDLQIRYGHDDRFEFTHTPDRKNVFGHNCRRQGLAALAPGVEAVGTCNGDVYYAPTYFEWMLGAMAKRDALFAYCNLVHSHLNWQPMKTELRRGKIDAGCWLADSEVVAGTPWEGEGFAADWFYIDRLLRQIPKGRVAKVDGYLCTHN